MNLSHVQAGYPEKTIFPDLSLSLPDQGIFALTGPSGSGKTTLLRLLAGLLKPQSGEITGIAGKKVAFMFQEDRLLPWATAEKNVALVSDTETARRWLSLMEMEDGSLYPHQMSGGMQRRVALARALAFGGDLLFLDEPFKGLDEALKTRIIPHVRTAAPFILLSIHDLEEAAAMGATLLELEKLL